MKKIVVVLFAAILMFAALGDVDPETLGANDLICEMLKPLLVRTNMRGDVFTTSPCAIADQTAFFRGSQDCSESERRRIFDWYLSHFDCLQGAGGSRDWDAVARAAVRQCVAMGYTNAVEIFKTNLWTGAVGPREAQASALVGWCGISDEVTDIFSLLMTNVCACSKRERNSLCRLYARKLEDSIGSMGAGAEEYNRGVVALYRVRMDVSCAIQVDLTLTRCLSGYAFSSNRLESARTILGSSDCYRSEIEHFTSVTNLLMSSPRHLVEIDL